MQFKLLAVGVAVAACFTSVANAGTVYYEGKGNLIEKHQNTTTETERILGGWHIENNVTEEMKAPLTSNVNVAGGNWNYIFGGSYVKTGGEFTVNSTNVVIDGKDTKGYCVVGGMVASDAQNAKFVGQSTNLTIKNGHFGQKKLSTNVLEQVLVAGDLIKSGNNTSSVSSSIKSTNVVIENGTFDAVVIGGSVAYGYYETPVNHSVSVDKVNMTITGGTFNEAIVVGGMAGGHNTSSKVDVANVAISGASGDLTINHNIYTGSLRTDGNNQTASVGKVNLNIEHATIQGLFDTDVKAHLQDDDWKTEGNHWVYDTYAPENSKPTETHATLTNVKAESIQIRNGSLTLGVVDNGLMSINMLTLGDDVDVAAVADGKTNDAVKGDINAFMKDNIQIGNNALKDVDVTLDEGEVIGKVTGSIVDGKLDEDTVEEAVNKKSLDVTHMVGMLPRFVTRVEMNDLRKRLGDLRATEGQNGVWARYDGGKLSGLGIDHKFNKIQVGADTMPTNNGIRFGAAMSYTQGDVDGAVSTADMDTYSLAGYGVWMGDQGQFVDVIARLAKINTEVKTSAYTADVDQLAFSLSGEVGMRFDLAKRLYIEPSVEATYTYVDGDSFKGTTSHFELDSTNSFMTRAGAALGWKLPNDRGDVYVRGGLVHEFMGDSKLSVNHGFRTVEVDGKDTWFEYAIGGNYRVTDTTYVWADLERSAAGDVDTDWRATVGARFVF